MSAQRDLLPLDEAQPQTEAIPFALKEQAAQRLAQHRARRTQNAPSHPPSNPAPTPTRASASRIAAAVAERYANSQSYRAFLAEQAEAAIRKAEAAAQVAALNAQAIADAQNQLLDELDQWALTAPLQPGPAAPPRIPEGTALAPSLTPSVPPAAPLTVKLYAEDQVALPHSELPVISNRFPHEPKPDESEALALEEEIAFRQSPVFEDMGPPIDIPANLIEFPRQLVASRKARPRLAEGPLREEADQTAHQDSNTAQLRIFEVEPDQISAAPVLESVTPEWSSILLSAQPVSTVVQAAPEAPYHPILAPQTASFSLRLMASIVDGCIIASAFLAFTAVVAITVGKLAGAPASAPRVTPQIAAVTAGVTLITLTFLYQLLFFTFSESTPGMRYARIGFCTLSDENPTRSAIRRRILATALAACPIGIGFLWAWFDDDGLGWHDRISRMYQRSY
jgi:uncharacterized RDD family membrane protein YckC